MEIGLADPRRSGWRQSIPHHSSGDRHGQFVDAGIRRKTRIAASWNERRTPMAFRILIVDDSPVMRSFARRVIHLSGFELSACLEASNGREALELLGVETVDAILTDITMPGMAGRGVLCR